MQFDPTEHPHRRYNPLLKTWVLVSPHRAKRPWQGECGKAAGAAMPAYEPGCYLCPGNGRNNGDRNPDYSETFVFDNDFPALLTDGPSERLEDRGLFVTEAERGVCRVICFTPRHNLSMAQMDLPSLRAVVDCWAEQYGELGDVPYVNYVQIFENREGGSSLHPHCQVWATERVPMDPEKCTAAQAEWLLEKGRPLLSDYLEEELRRGERLICENEHFVALAPFWAVWPYELMAIPRRHFGSLLDMTGEERDGLADIMRRITVRLDNLFQAPFPYSMGIRQAPTDGVEHPEWRLHLHLTSSVLRSPTIPKFMVGYERLCEPQRDFTPEIAAQRLREMPEKHYMSG